MFLEVNFRSQDPKMSTRVRQRLWSRRARTIKSKDLNINNEVDTNHTAQPIDNELDNIDIPCANGKFKGIGNRLVGCNGDCGSPFAKIIDHCIHHKV